MNPIVSCPANMCDMDKYDQPEFHPTLSKSPSLDSFLNIKENVSIHFEGDGPLGIYFNLNDKGLIEVTDILEGTAASEYFKLEVGMIVEKVNNYHTYDFIYENFMKLIGIIWTNYSEITIEFTKPIKNEIHLFLEKINCSDHYDFFYDLGAKTLEDLVFVEEGDLKDMSKIDKCKITSSIKKINSEVFDMDSP